MPEMTVKVGHVGPTTGPQAHLGKDNENGARMAVDDANAKGVTIPVAVSVFPGEQYEAPLSWTEKAYPNLIYYNKLEKGGHFAAWEQPQLFSEEMRAAFKSLR